MSTRCNIIVKDGYENKLYFYRHSDGYPEGTMPILEKFMNHVKAGNLRNNVGQSAGWLIIFGAAEYDVNFGKAEPSQKNTLLNSYEPTNEGYSGWKVGAIEPTTGLHGDIEYLYVLDLATKKIRIVEKDFELE